MRRDPARFLRPHRPPAGRSRLCPPAPCPGAQDHGAAAGDTWARAHRLSGRPSARRASIRRVGRPDLRRCPGARPSVFIAQREPDKWGFLPPGGESYAQLADRMGEWYRAVERDVVVAAHGGTARALWPISRSHRRKLPRAIRSTTAWSISSRTEADALRVGEDLTRPGRELPHQIPCRSIPSVICSGSPPSARAMGRRSAAWSTAVRRASR